jgi:hypothetical protein
MTWVIIYSLIIKNTCSNTVAGFVCLQGQKIIFCLTDLWRLFKKRANQLSPAITVELVPGANHWSIWSESFTQRMHREFDAKIE